MRRREKPPPPPLFPSSIFDSPFLSFPPLPLQYSSSTATMDANNTLVITKVYLLLAVYKNVNILFSAF